MSERAARLGTGALLGALCFGAFAYFYQAGSWNSTTRFDLVRAIVEHHTLSIDAYHPNTGDKALRDGRYYCDKAPGVSLLCVPSYAVVHWLDGEHREMDHVQTLGSYLCVLTTVSLPSALSVVALLLLLQSLGLRRPWPMLLAAGYALGTLVWPYSTLFYGHQASTAWVLIGFSILARSRLDGRPLTAVPAAGAGLCLGLAVLVEYTAGLAVACVGLYALASVGWRRPLVWIAAGAALPVAALLAYHWAAFGAPWTLPYDFSTQRHRHTGLFMGIGVPSGRALYYLLIDEYRGLFYSAPWLLLAVPGLALLLASQRTRPEGLLATFLVVAHVLVAGGLTDWHGGWAMGPRHLISTLPWLVLGVGALALRAGGPASGRRRAGHGLLLGLAAAGIAFSAFMMLVGTAVRPEVPRAVEQPFHEYLFPRFFSGELAVSTQSIDFVTGRGRTKRFAWNLGELMGLEGLPTLVPLAAWVLGMGGWIAWRERRASALGRQPPDLG